MSTRLPPLNNRAVDVELMSHDTSDLFIRCSMAEDAARAPLTIDALIEKLGRDAMNVPQFAILISRFRTACQFAPELSWTPQVVLFAASLSDSPGGIVCWAYTLVELARKGPCDMWALTLAFPNGFPTQQAMVAYWDGQKAASGNRLDQLETWMAPAEATA